MSAETWRRQCDQPRERGLRLVGAWPPDDAFDALLKLIDERLGAETDDSKRSRLEALRQNILDMGKAAAVSLFVE